MSGESSRNDAGRRGLWSGLLAMVPVVLSALMGMSLREAPALVRDGTPRRSLQFAQYCLNYGEDPIPPSAALTSRFRFRNVGETTIELGEVERSCGCLTPQLSHHRLQPGEIGEMTVSVPLTEQSAGSHEFQLTVHYSDSQPRFETVLIKAVFPEPEIHVTPRAMEVSRQGSSDQPMQHRFTVTDRRSQPLRVEAVESSSPWVTGHVAAEESDGEVTRIAMQVDGAVPAGTHRVLLQAVTNDPQFPVVQMPIRLRGPERTRPVEVQPSMLRMHAADLSPQVVLVRVPADWDISHADCFPSQLQCRWQPVESASGHASPTNVTQLLRLNVELTEAPAYGMREGVVTLHTSDRAEMLTLRVELLGTMQRRADELTATSASAGETTN